MRKTALILLGLFCCLLATAGGSGGRWACVPETAAVLTIDQASNDEWRCERTYNSDLGVPRICGEVSAPAAVPTSLRTAASESARTYARCLSGRHDAPASGLAFNCFAQSFDLSVGVHPVDHYVYRLRRLII